MADIGMPSSPPNRSLSSIVLLGLISFSSMLHGGFVQSADSSSSSGQPYRTSFHFQPSAHWMNDPNGPMIYKGVYHLFYQYNPKAAVWEWGSVVWAHSTSTDLVNWESQPIAIQPSQPSDIEGCWSGSSTILPGGKPAILYTGVDYKMNQVQNLIVPKNFSDPLLIEWVKSDRNPVIAPSPRSNINSSSFRDPSTAWLGPDNQWRVLIGSLRNSRGLVLLFRSKDFLHWVKARHPLYSLKGYGTLECPDLYPVNTTGRGRLDTSATEHSVKHILKFSLDFTRHDLYVVGKYDAVKDTFVPDQGQVEGEGGLRYDYGKFYASKSFYDYDKNRRILWGWVNESTSRVEDIRRGWAGVQAIPRTVWLDMSGKHLLQWPVVEIERLRTKRVDLTPQVLKSGTMVEVSGVSATQADVEITFEPSHLDEAEDFDPNWKDPQILCNERGASVKGRVGPFGLYVMTSKGLEEFTAVFFRVFKGQHKAPVVVVCTDLHNSSLNKYNDKMSFGAFLDVEPVRGKLSLSLRCLVDHSIVEAFAGGGKVCITSRVYPTKAINGAAQLFVFNEGTKDITLTNLTAWSMKQATIS